MNRPCRRSRLARTCNLPLESASILRWPLLLRQINTNTLWVPHPRHVFVFVARVGSTKTVFICRIYSHRTKSRDRSSALVANFERTSHADLQKSSQSHPLPERWGKTPRSSGLLQHPRLPLPRRNRRSHSHQGRCRFWPRAPYPFRPYSRDFRSSPRQDRIHRNARKSRYRSPGAPETDRFRPAPVRPDGLVQTPNIIDDMPDLRRLYQYLRDHNVWHATGTEIASYVIARERSLVYDVTLDGFSLRYDGRVERPL